MTLEELKAKYNCEIQSCSFVHTQIGLAYTAALEKQVSELTAKIEEMKQIEMVLSERLAKTL